MSVGWATVKLGGTHLGAGHELTKANYILSERERLLQTLIAMFSALPLISDINIGKGQGWKKNQTQSHGSLSSIFTHPYRGCFHLGTFLSHNVNDYKLIWVYEIILICK
jgi:hypothetical protein